MSVVQTRTCDRCGVDVSGAGYWSLMYGQRWPHTDETRPVDLCDPCNTAFGVFLANGRRDESALEIAR